MHVQSSVSIFEHPLLGRGFRPFFMMAAGYSVLSLVFWVGIQMGIWDAPEVTGDPVLWHAHEMIYGFVMAVVAGFLLTAVANWTGGAPVRQLHLLILCILWLGGRIVMHASGLPVWLVGIVDCSFIPALAISLSLPLIKNRNVRNFIFLGILTVLFICNIVFFVMQERLPLHIALLTIVTMISLVGGRIIPAFTVAGLRRIGLVVYQQEQTMLDRLCLFFMAALMAVFMVLGPETIAAGTVAFTAGVLQLLRLRNYHVLKALKEPMLWILHAGFGWLVLGLFMLGFYGYGFGTLSIALHALTAGCIGSMCIGMMCRVTLGHTGRNLIAKPVTKLIFILMQITAFLRVGGPLFFPQHYMLWIGSSGVLWAVCFALYLPVYIPMLVKPRPDGISA